MDALIVGWALDTNGQNQRFKAASDRWGTDPAVTSALAVGKDDPAGVVGRFAIAAEKLGGLSIRSVQRTRNYLNFPVDILWTRETHREIVALAEAADVLHLNNSYVPAQRLRVTRKPMLLHHHGSLFRNKPEVMLNVARSQRMTQAVSTLDLTRPNPEVLHWLPTAYDVDWLQEFAKKRRQGARLDPDRIRVVHCPTNREFKATLLLEAAVRELQAEGLPVDLVLVEGKPWTESLLAKATADIVFDQLAWGYGCNGVEAMGMGVPLLTGADEWTLARMRQVFGRLPFYQTTAETLTADLRKLVKSKALRQRWGAKGLEHVRKYHDEKPALARLAELYVRTIQRYETPMRSRLERPVRFRNVLGRAVAVDGVRVAFENGEHVTQDPFVIARLRYFAEKRPTYGIVEVTG
jgi:hypothetical protein